MQRQRSRQAHRARELRRRVTLPARLGSGASWTDACILNISRRGLLVYAPRARAAAAFEVRRDDHVIRGRVIWRDGARIGLQAEDLIPVEEIMSLSDAHTIELAAGPQPSAARTAWADAADRSRRQGRALEFAAVTIIAAALALSTSSMMEAGFARPLAAVSAALGGAAPQS